MAFDLKKFGLITNGVATACEIFCYDSADALTALKGANYFDKAVSAGLKVGNGIRCQKDGVYIGDLIVKSISNTGAVVIEDRTPAVI